MTEGAFCRYELRTTDPDAARVFYADVVGASALEPPIAIVPLPARAAAHGAPAHWLGLVAVRDVDDACGGMIAGGGQLLGPVRRDDDGASVAALRDPFGSVVGVCAATPSATPSVVGWHLLHAEDGERAFAFYARLFGWTAKESWDLGGGMGSCQAFAWDATARS